MQSNKPRPTLRQALQKAEKYCAYQERSHSEVVKKLNDMGLNWEETESVLHHLVQSNFLNEERFAKAFAGGKFRAKQWGRKKIIYQLKAKGINNQIIGDALAQISDSDYLETLQKLIIKKDRTMKKLDEFAKKQKIIQYLILKGYEMDLAIAEVNKYCEK